MVRQLWDWLLLALFLRLGVLLEDDVDSMWSGSYVWPWRGVVNRADLDRLPITHLELNRLLKK